MKAVILDYQSLAPSDLDQTALWALPFDWTVHEYSTAAQAEQRVQGMDIVLSNKVVLDKKLLQANPQIKLIIVLATGTNNVDLAAAQQLGIQVSNIVAYSTESVVQHTFACLLHLQNRLQAYATAVKQGLWSDSQSFTFLDYPIQELSGKTLGIIGYGAIGKRVQHVAEAFGMHVLISQSVVPGKLQAGRTAFSEVLAQSDVLSLHAPLSPYTQNLIDDKALASMKKSAIVLNMARGGIVNEEALLAALEQGIIAAAATDVLSQEPPPVNHPLLRYAQTNLLITPHIAWASQQARQVLLQQVEAILQGFLNGQPINQVNPS